VIRSIVAVAEAHRALTREELALIESHLPRSVAMRRAVPRVAPFEHTIHPVHAVKNGLAWLYNINKGGVYRVSQHVARLLGCLDFWPLAFGWES
jgi:hypothetical protein